MTEKEKTFISSRDLRLSSTAGHITTMTAGEPKLLPEPLHEEARKAGAVSLAQLDSMREASETESNKEGYVITPADYADPSVPLPDDLTSWEKKELDTLATLRFGADLNGRMSKEKMIAKIAELEHGLLKQGAE